MFNKETIKLKKNYNNERIIKKTFIMRIPLPHNK